MGAQQCHRLVGPGRVTNEVAEMVRRIHRAPSAAYVFEDSLERRQVGVDVRDKRVAHDRVRYTGLRARTNALKILPDTSRATASASRPALARNARASCTSYTRVGSMDASTNPTSCSM